MTPTYRWSTSDFATGYDAAAEVIHPHYLEIQDAILRLLAGPLASNGLVVDLGGGSGRLAERILEQYPAAQVLVIDQSEPFLAIAERRLAKFGQRAACVLAQLQDEWEQHLQSQATAIVSMSAIHHLEPAEKQALYRQCANQLQPGGVLVNGDEVRPADDADYWKALSQWAEHMRQKMATNSIPETFHSALHGWIDRNVTRFGQAKHSGDDCHETIEAQLGYFRAAGLRMADVPWQRELWAVLRGSKGTSQASAGFENS